MVITRKICQCRLKDVGWPYQVHRLIDLAESFAWQNLLNPDEDLQKIDSLFVMLLS